MTAEKRTLVTRRGVIRFPAYIPVTTFGDRYPLDKLVQPYLPRLAPAMMVSYYYARQIEGTLRLPLLVDSGGFVSLFKSAQVIQTGKLGTIQIANDDGVDTIHPKDVLDLQERIADVAFGLDFPIPPSMDEKKAQHRMDLTIANAYWALENRRRKDLPLYACVQAWDADSARQCAQAYAGAAFDGIAIGGLVPRARNLDLVLSIVKAVRMEVSDLPLHVFGLGKPEIANALFEVGTDSVDSSSYVKLAADGRLWSHPRMHYQDPSPIDRLHLALCNLALATGQALPLPMTKMVFTTHSLSMHTSLDL
ncbi:MAG: tRNA-guanine transglycosylase [Chloroflexi bacterium]|nr:tRNA-guanine transglycosylase [Chloroflexota bacterium]